MRSLWTDDHSAGYSTDNGGQKGHMRRNTHLLYAILFVLMNCCTVAAQERPIVVGNELDQYVRLLEIQGKIIGMPLLFRPLTVRNVMGGLRTDSSHVWQERYALASALVHSGPRLTPILPVVDFVYNSTYPRSENDGALWASRGLSAQVSGGAALNWGPVTATIFPTIYHTQNKDFDLAPVPFSDRTKYAYPWSSDIDFPQRFGGNAITEFDWGQSGVRLDAGAFTAGLTTENMWWGPAFMNPIIMSNTGPGFPHIDVGTGHPVSTPIGPLETRIIWGQLRESDYFDSDPQNQRRFFNGVTLALNPRFLPGLTIGVTRILYQTWPTTGIGTGEIFDIFSRFFARGDLDTLPDGRVVNDPTDQILSLVFRWIMPESNFEAYVEWSRNDFNADLRDLALEPDHSRNYSIGFQKAFSTESGTTRLRAEFTTLGRAATFQTRLLGTIYLHNIATQGYTHRGQLIGAGIGPGSQSQYVGVDRYTTSGRWGVYLQRVRFNDDYFFDNFPNRLNHDVEFTLGTSMLRFLGDVDLGVAVELSRRLNWQYVLELDVSNLKLRLSIGWRGDR